MLRGSAAWQCVVMRGGAISFLLIRFPRQKCCPAAAAGLLGFVRLCLFSLHALLSAHLSSQRSSSSLRLRLQSTGPAFNHQPPGRGPKRSRVGRPGLCHAPNSCTQLCLWPGLSPNLLPAARLQLLAPPPPDDRAPVAKSAPGPSHEPICSAATRACSNFYPWLKCCRPNAADALALATRLHRRRSRMVCPRICGSEPKAATHACRARWFHGRSAQVHATAGG
jgi:hypothetical protein